MIIPKTELPKEKKDTAKSEKERLLIVLLSNSGRLAAEYRTLIAHTGGLLTSSMVFAYTKGLNDALKLLTQDKGKTNEESVQAKEG